MVVGGYCYHLYCDCFSCTCKRTLGTPPKFEEIAGVNEKEAHKIATERGWRFSKKKTKVFAPGHKAEKY